MASMKINRKFLTIAASLALAAIIPLLVFHTRSPVLIVTEQSFIDLYGEARIRGEALRSSLALFRPVKTVAVTNDAGDDIVRFAIDDVSSRPFCVLFPLRFARAARLYRGQYPGIPVVLLEGRFPDNENPSAFAIDGDISDYFIYKTDIDADFYRTALAAAALDKGKNGKIVVFLEPGLRRQAREAFLQALNDIESPLEPLFFTSFSQFSEMPDISCVVMAGIGSEYLDEKSGVPVIFFTWIDPSFLPADVVLVVNDSPWAQAVQAVKMSAAREEQGRIRSNFLLQNNKNIDRETLRKILKTG
jgi:hypothetical protein